MERIKEEQAVEMEVIGITSSDDLTNPDYSESTDT